MAEQNLVLSFTAQIFRVLCSYPISGKTVLLSGAARGHGLAIAQACVMATASHLILVGPNHTDLAEAKAFLESTMEDPIKQTVVHTYFSQDVDQDRIASIFFAVRSELGTPDVLILGNACPAPDKPIFEYNADDIDTCLDLNAKGKKAFIQNFLAPGTKKRKILINVSISAGAQNTIWRGRDWNAMQLLAHGNEEGGKWAFTVYDLLSDLISTQKIGGALIRRGQALDDSRSAIECSELADTVMRSGPLRLHWAFVDV